MNRRHLIALVAIVVAFALFLPLYYMFSYGKSDALEHTIEEGNPIDEGGYEAPFSYGDDYLQSIAAGVLGLIIVFSVFYLLMMAIRKRGPRKSE